jgi:methanogenic corrinoid protein MtbC1
MSDSGAADGCHVQQLDVAIRDSWGDARGNRDAASPAVLSSRLHSVVFEQIVPRLALIHREWASGAAATPPTHEEIDAFGQAILAPDPTAADQLFQRLRERGLSVDALFESLLAPTARRFGELWEQDLCDFVDVTIGVNRLRIMLEIYANAPIRSGDPRRRALLISMPEERHVFGLNVVASFLRSSGWEAMLAVDRRADENAETVAESWFAVVGITVSEEGRLAAAARAIEAVRRASLNRSIAVMVGGGALQGRPDLVVRIGGDAIAEDGPSAALLAQKLFLAQADSRSASN